MTSHLTRVSRQVADRLAEIVATPDEDLSLEGVRHWAGKAVEILRVERLPVHAREEELLKQVRDLKARCEGILRDYEREL